MSRYKVTIEEIRYATDADLKTHSDTEVIYTQTVENTDIISIINTLSRGLDAGTGRVPDSAVLLRGLHGTSYDWDDRQNDYNRREPIAWANARAALAEEEERDTFLLVAARRVVEADRALALSTSLINELDVACKAAIAARNP